MSSRIPQPDQSPAPAHADPAAACENWEYIASVLTPLGLTALAIEVKSQADEAWPWLPDTIGPKLEDAKLGLFDAYRVRAPITFFFNVQAERIADVLQLVRTELQTLGILHRCKIGYAEAEAKVWRTYVPESGGTKV